MENTRIVTAVLLVIAVFFAAGDYAKKHYDAEMKRVTVHLTDAQRIEVIELNKQLRNLHKGDFVDLVNSDGNGTSTFVLEGYEQPHEDKLLLRGKDLISTRVLMTHLPEEMFKNWQNVKNICRTTDPGYQQNADWFYIQ